MWNISKRPLRVRNSGVSLLWYVVCSRVRVTFSNVNTNQHSNTDTEQRVNTVSSTREGRKDDAMRTVCSDLSMYHVTISLFQEFQILSETYRKVDTRTIQRIIYVGPSSRILDRAICSRDCTTWTRRGKDRVWDVQRFGWDSNGISTLSERTSDLRREYESSLRHIILGRYHDIMVGTCVWGENNHSLRANICHVRCLHISRVLALSIEMVPFSTRYRTLYSDKIAKCYLLTTAWYFRNSCESTSR